MIGGPWRWRGRRRRGAWIGDSGRDEDEAWVKDADEDEDGKRIVVLDRARSMARTRMVAGTETKTKSR